MYKFILPFILLFVVKSSLAQEFPQVQDVILNHDKAVEINRLYIFNDPGCVFFTIEGGYEVFKKKTKEIYFYNTKLSAVTVHTFYTVLSMNEILNKISIIDRTTLIGNTQSDMFVVYDTSKCYCIVGEKFGKKYKITYVWDCD